jgi:hypothetical protein
MPDHTHLLICTSCYAERVPPARARLGYRTCLSCGDKQARAVRHTIAPMNKSNYMLFTDPELLKQLNPKRTQS